MDFVNERQRGKLPLSIGTSLAFESLLNINDNITHPRPLYEEDYKVVWVNLKTLYRNIYGAVDREKLDMTSDEQFSKAMFFEIDNIRDICNNEAKGMDVVFYSPNYKNLEKINNETLLRMDNTSLQKTFTTRMNNCLKIVLPEFNRDTEITDSKRIRIYDNKITDTETRSALMVTSYAYDLVSFRKFAKLALLETHTGKVKDRTEWYTKYYNGKDLPEMPFRLDLLTIMGDNSLFRTKVPKFKQEIIRLAEEFRWSSITTTDKIKANIETIKDHQIRLRLLDIIES